MLFNSLSFVVFLVIVLALYYSKLFNWTNKKRMLLFASYVFYGLWNPPLVILLWISTVVDWTAGKRLAVEENQRKRKFWLLLSMFVNLGFLAFFKYGDFLLENFVSIVNSFGVDYKVRPMDIILPMGISFYTFQTMSYTIDLYKRKIKPARTFLDFALYVTFFPQLVAGPIVRAKDLITQFYEEKRATSNQFVWGVFLLTIGLFQKVVLADTLLSGVADDVFGSSKLLHGIDAWTGTLAFSGQIFFDFAGYSTCAIGIALMLGIILPDNFKVSLCFSRLFRFMGQMAYFFIKLVTRLFVHSFRRQSSWYYQNVCCFNAHHVIRWSLAWRSLDLYGLGRITWYLPDFREITKTIFTF